MSNEKFEQIVKIYSPYPQPLPVEMNQKIVADFNEATSAQSILAKFAHLCKYFQIDTRFIFDNGLNLSHEMIRFKIDEYNKTFVNKYQKERLRKEIEHLHHLNCNDSEKTRLLFKIFDYRTISWGLREICQLLNKRSQQTVYDRHYSLSGQRAMNVLIVGAGPVGLRLSLECAFMHMRCTLIEKRDEFTRHNCVHIWPYVKTDLANLGARKFLKKFCTSSINHISIRSLQSILLKMALLSGVRVCFNTSFSELVEPSNLEEGGGWRAHFVGQHSHLLSKESFDVVIGADGPNSSLPHFERKLHPKPVGIALTANFVNKNTDEEKNVCELGGLAYQFNQQYFDKIKEISQMDLENLVYYKGETHYFVMAVKRESLVNLGVFKQSFLTPSKLLLEKENIHFDRLCQAIKNVVQVATRYELKELVYVKNHLNENDVAIFDFTNLSHAEHSTKIIEKNGHTLLISLCGDSLIEPFWPQGTGIGRGFMSAFDCAWSLRSFQQGQSPVQILMERESAYRKLVITTSDNLRTDYEKYTIDPQTRYGYFPMTFTQSEAQRLYVNLDHLKNNHAQVSPINSSKMITIKENDETMISDVIETKKRVRDLIEIFQMKRVCSSSLMDINESPSPSTPQKKLKIKASVFDSPLRTPKIAPIPLRSPNKLKQYSLGCNKVVDTEKLRQTKASVNQSFVKNKINFWESLMKK